MSKHKSTRTDRERREKLQLREKFSFYHFGDMTHSLRIIGRWNRSMWWHVCKIKTSNRVQIARKLVWAWFCCQTTRKRVTRRGIDVRVCICCLFELVDFWNVNRWHIEYIFYLPFRLSIQLAKGYKRMANYLLWNNKAANRGLIVRITDRRRQSIPTDGQLLIEKNLTNNKNMQLTVNRINLKVLPGQNRHNKFLSYLGNY